MLGVIKNNDAYGVFKGLYGESSRLMKNLLLQQEGQMKAHFSNGLDHRKYLWRKFRDVTNVHRHFNLNPPRIGKGHKRVLLYPEKINIYVEKEGKQPKKIKASDNLVKYVKSKSDGTLYLHIKKIETELFSLDVDMKHLLLGRYHQLPYTFHPNSLENWGVLCPLHRKGTGSPTTSNDDCQVDVT